LVLLAAESPSLPASLTSSRLVARGFAEAPNLDWPKVTNPRALARWLESHKQTYVLVLPQGGLAAGRNAKTQ